MCTFHRSTDRGRIDEKANPTYWGRMSGATSYGGAKQTHELANGTSLPGRPALTHTTYVRFIVAALIFAVDASEISRRQTPSDRLHPYPDRSLR